jgi:hypothetical protein
MKKQDNFRTLSGKKTKDTLTIPELQKLEKKKENDTLTGKERERLRMDDSINSFRSTHGWVYKDREEEYNPNVEYFMIDYQRTDEIKWVRMNYMTQFELLPFIRDFVENFGNYQGFRIHSEWELDLKSKVMCKDDVEREMTLRQDLFGENYQRFSDYVKCDDPNNEFYHFFRGMKKGR